VKAAREANRISEQANRNSVEANDISRQANEIAERNAKFIKDESTKRLGLKAEWGYTILMPKGGTEPLRAKPRLYAEVVNLGPPVFIKHVVLDCGSGRGTFSLWTDSAGKGSKKNGFEMPRGKSFRFSMAAAGWDAASGRRSVASAVASTCRFAFLLLTPTLAVGMSYTEALPSFAMKATAPCAPMSMPMTASPVPIPRLSAGMR
jgi:hypothetical protein